MGRFSYLPLEHDIREIRLLTLDFKGPAPDHEPAASGSPSIHLSLSHASLDAQPAPVFSALSYVWGDANDTRSINLDGQTFQVTKNLFTALTRLYTDKFSGYLWIDAICINQSDNEEKRVQVMLMSYIYTRAAEVLIWLGPEPDHGALSMIQFMGEMFRGQVSTRAGKGDGEFNRWAEASVKTVRQFAVTEGYQENLRWGFNFETIWIFFSQRPWWRRVWIIQEVVLAKKAMVLCGTASVPWDDVAECLEMLQWMVLYPSIEPQHRRLYDIVGAITQSVMHLSLAGSGYQRSLKDAAGNTEKAGMSLLETLTWTSANSNHDGGIQATDPRDRIYGLLGIMRPEDRQRIMVDYSDKMNLNKIVFEVNKAVLMDHGPDVMTHYQGPLAQADGGTPPPSWIIDWTALRVQVVPGVSLASEDGNEYSASKGTSWGSWSSRCQIQKASYEQPRISLWGRTVSQVIAVGSQLVTPPASPGFLEAAKMWLLEVESMIENHRVSSSVSDIHTNDDMPSSSSDSTLSNVWRVPIADIGVAKRVDHEVPARFIHAFEVLTGRKQPPEELASEEERSSWILAESWDFRRSWKVYGRRAFLDSDGRPGTSIKNVQVGDQIVIFAGGHVPFVIRPIADELGQVSYQFVGSAYVFGLMDGEAMERGLDFEEIHLD